MGIVEVENLSFQKDDFKEYLSEIDKWKNHDKIILLKDEYAHVISELNTHMSEEDRLHAVVSKPIGDYVYTIINNDFDDYVIIGKRPIISGIVDEWEEME